jgi:hypothetical protein
VEKVVEFLIRAKLGFVLKIKQGFMLGVSGRLPQNKD